MKKTLALLLAAAFLYVAASAPFTTRSQSLTATAKFHTVANPIPNRFIVVLSTTNLNPIADPTPTTKAPVSTRSATPADAFTIDSSSTPFIATPVPTDPDVTATATALTNEHGGSFSTTWSNALKGFRLHATQAQAISMSNDSRVAFVTQDGAIAVGTPDTDPIVMGPPDPFQNPQPNASWGLDRIDQRFLPLDREYAYTNNGSGVNAYVIDTGILPTHPEFGGRAFAVYDAVDREGSGIDCNGHGSHVAGTIGGQTYGVAKGVRLFGVRVLNCQGTGTWSDVIDGVNFVTWHRGQSAQQPYAAVANMSLSGDGNRAVDVAVRNSIRAQITYVVAAGNSSSDASTYSPARVQEAITVGATDQEDIRAQFSNFGSTLDLFGPGVSITSAWISTGAEPMIATASGTSMASPHVAGVVAQYLQLNRTASPAVVRAALIGISTSGLIRDPGELSPNRLLYTEY